MHLFIANGSQQVQAFHYRVPEVKQPRQQTIPIGGQIRITGGRLGSSLTKIEVDAIIEQHRKYGLIPADEILRGRSAAPLAYRVDKHITSEEIALLNQRNQGVLDLVGQESRKNAAIVIATNLGKSAQEGGTGANFENAEVEIVEEPGKGDRVSTSKLEEKTVIEREDRVGQTRSGSRRRGGR